MELSCGSRVVLSLTSVWVCVCVFFSQWIWPTFDLLSGQRSRRRRRLQPLACVLWVIVWGSELGCWAAINLQQQSSIYTSESKLVRIVGQHLAGNPLLTTLCRRQAEQVVKGLLDRWRDWWRSGQMIALRLETVLIIGGVVQCDQVTLGRGVRHRSPGDDHVTGVRRSGLLQGSGLLSFDSIGRLIAASI